MTDGILNATVSGDPLYAAFEDANGSNCTVTVSCSSLVTAGTYLVKNVSEAAVKCGSVSVSGGTVRIVASGVASRGLCADTTLAVTGGFFDICAYGTASNLIIELEDESDLTSRERTSVRRPPRLDPCAEFGRFAAVPAGIQVEAERVGSVGPSVPSATFQPCGSVTGAPSALQPPFSGRAIEETPHARADARRIGLKIMMAEIIPHPRTADNPPEFFFGGGGQASA